MWHGKRFSLELRGDTPELEKVSIDLERAPFDRINIWVDLIHYFQEQGLSMAKSLSQIMGQTIRK